MMTMDQTTMDVTHHAMWKLGGNALTPKRPHHHAVPFVAMESEFLTKRTVMTTMKTIAMAVTQPVPSSLGGVALELTTKFRAVTTHVETARLCQALSNVMMVI